MSRDMKEALLFDGLSAFAIYRRLNQRIPPRGSGSGIPVMSNRGVISRVMCVFKRRVCHLSLRPVARRAIAVYPPATGEQPLIAGILDLATRRMCGASCRHDARWALTPPFHPYPLRIAGGSFLSHYPRRRRRLPIKKCAALCCPDFPLYA